MSELKSVSLSRIARENLVNFDDATIHLNDKNPVRYSMSHIFLRNSEETFRVFVLINVWCSLRSRRLEVVGKRKNGARARGRHARGEEAPAQEAHENGVNAFSKCGYFLLVNRLPRG